MISFMNRLKNTILPHGESNGQKIRIICTLMGIFSMIFGYQLIRILGGITWIMTGENLLVRVIGDPSLNQIATDTAIMVFVVGMICWCGRYIKKNDAPQPDGWGRPLIQKSDVLGHPDILWAIRRVWESGYVREGHSIYFTTLRDILKRAGLSTSATQIRSALEIAHCPVTRDTVHGNELAILFQAMDGQIHKDPVEIEELEATAWPR